MTKETTMTKTRTGWSGLLAGQNLIFSLALGGGVTLHAVNIHIATTILPSVVKDIGGLDYYAWSTTLFVVASILGSALSARLLQSAGPRGAYGTAALLFAVGTVICAVAPNMPVMLAGRFVQGFGGGFLYALAYAVIRLVFPEALWARAIGLISAMWGVATLIGPAIGGGFAELDAWRAAFWSLVPLIAVFAVMALATLPKRDAGRHVAAKLPVPQLVLLTAAVLVLSAGSVVRDTFWNIAGVASALALVGLLIATEARARERLLPKGALNVAAPLGALYATVALLMIGMQPELFVPYFLQMLHAQSPLMAGYLAALMAIGWTTGSMLSSSWSGHAMRRVIVAAPILVLLALTTLVMFLPTQSAGDWRVIAPICLGLTLVGLGIGLSWPHLVTRVFQIAPASEQSLAASAITTVQLFATALGAAAAGMAANLAGLIAPGGIDGAASAAFWLFAVFALAPAVCIVTALRAVGSAPQKSATPLLFAKPEVSK
jgi:MFS family permease